MTVDLDYAQQRIEDQNYSLNRPEVASLLPLNHNLIPSVRYAGSIELIFLLLEILRPMFFI